MSSLDNFLKRISVATRNNSTELRLSVKDCSDIKAEIDKLRADLIAAQTTKIKELYEPPVQNITFMSISGGKFN